MARGAFAFAKENRLATGCVAGSCSHLILALQRPQVGDDRANLRFAEAVKSWHAGSGHTVRNDIGDLGVRKVPYFSAFRDVDGLIAPVAIQSVASSASGVISVLAGKGIDFRFSIGELLLRERDGNVENTNPSKE